MMMQRGLACVMLSLAWACAVVQAQTAAPTESELHECSSGAWGEWSDCSAACDETGLRTRNRTVTCATGISVEVDRETCLGPSCSCEPAFVGEGGDADENATITSGFEVVEEAPCVRGDCPPPTDPVCPSNPDGEGVVRLNRATSNLRQLVFMDNATEELDEELDFYPLEEIVEAKHGMLPNTRMTDDIGTGTDERETTPSPRRRRVDNDSASNRGGRLFSAAFLNPGTKKDVIHLPPMIWALFRVVWLNYASSGYRLVDIETHRLGTQRMWGGLMEKRGGGHAIWVDASWSSFKSKWDTWSASGLRLVDLEVYRDGATRRVSLVLAKGVHNIMQAVC